MIEMTTLYKAKIMPGRDADTKTKLLAIANGHGLHVTATRYTNGLLYGLYYSQRTRLEVRFRSGMAVA
jgi:hypothetical protein